jgi:hypothetical protein
MAVPLPPQTVGESETISIIFYVPMPLAASHDE